MWQDTCYSVTSTLLVPYWYTAVVVTEPAGLSSLETGCPQSLCQDAHFWVLTVPDGTGIGENLQVLIFPAGTGNSNIDVNLEFDLWRIKDYQFMEDPHGMS